MFFLKLNSRFNLIDAMSTNLSENWVSAYLKAHQIRIFSLEGNYLAPPQDFALKAIMAPAASGRVPVSLVCVCCPALSSLA